MDIKLIRTQSWHAFITKSSTGAPRPIWHKALLQFKLYWRTSLNAVHFLDNFAKLWFLCQLPLIKWSWTLTNIHWKVMSQTRQNLPGEGCGGRGVQNTYGHLVPPSWLPFSTYLYLDLHLHETSITCKNAAYFRSHSNCRRKSGKYNGTLRLEICQKIYTTGFSVQKFYTLKVRNLRLFLLKKKQRKCINLVAFFCQNWTECVRF